LISTRGSAGGCVTGGGAAGGIATGGRERDTRSASAQSDAAVARCTIASDAWPRAASDSAPLNTLSPLAMSVGVAPASSARLIAASALARSERTSVS
jgi:hypothetical protein